MSGGGLMPDAAFDLIEEAVEKLEWIRAENCTVHVATLEVDDGPILAQEAVPVLDDDDEGTLHERIKSVERRLYVDTIRRVIDRPDLLLGRAAEGAKPMRAQF